MRIFVDLGHKRIINNLALFKIKIRFQQYQKKIKFNLRFKNGFDLFELWTSWFETSTLQIYLNSF